LLLDQKNIIFSIKIQIQIGTNLLGQLAEVRTYKQIQNLSPLLLTDGILLTTLDFGAISNIALSHFFLPSQMSSISVFKTCQSQNI